MGKSLMRAGFFIALALIGVGLWASGPLLAEARIGAAFIARTTCSCVFVAGRTLDSCREDWPAGSDLLDVRQRPSSVEASAMLSLVHAEADFDPDYGCTLP